MLIVLVIICLVLGFYAVWEKTTGDSASPVTTVTTETTLPDRTTEFLDAFENSFVGPYTVTGILEFSNSQALTRQSVRRARLDDRSLDQIGGGAVVTGDGTLRRCSDDGTQFLCTEPEPEPTLDDRRSGMVDLIAQGYQVNQTSKSCFVLIADGDGSFSPLGTKSTYCFDAATGAISSRITEKGQRTESFIADEIQATVEDQDLDPK